MKDLTGVYFCPSIRSKGECKCVIISQCPAAYHTQSKIQKINDNPIYLHKKVTFGVSFQTCTKYAENCIQSVSIRTAVSCKRGGGSNPLARSASTKALENWLLNTEGPVLLPLKWRNAHCHEDKALKKAFLLPPPIFTNHSDKIQKNQLWGVTVI